MFSDRSADLSFIDDRHLQVINLNKSSAQWASFCCKGAQTMWVSPGCDYHTGECDNYERYLNLT